MIFGMAVASRIMVGEEPCPKKVLYEIKNPSPVDAKAIRYRLEHELLVSETIETLKGEIFVNEWVSRTIGGIQLSGKIDIVNVNNGETTIIEVKSGRKKVSHCIQLWMYMKCLDARRIKGELRYNDAVYTYTEMDMPLNLWTMVFLKIRPLLSDNPPPVKGSHCRYCRFKSTCRSD